MARHPNTRRTVGKGLAVVAVFAVLLAGIGLEVTSVHGSGTGGGGGTGYTYTYPHLTRNHIWAGYVSQGPSVNVPVHARVILPQLTCNVVGEMGMWVGYDGYVGDSQTVEQEGVSAFCNQIGYSPTYGLWYEFYEPIGWGVIDTGPQYVRWDLAQRLVPGDAVDMFESIIQADRVGPVPLARDKVYFSLTVDDPGTGTIIGSWSQAVSEPWTFTPKYNSSECIAEGEAVDYISRYANVGLPQFDPPVQFVNCSVFDSNNHYRIVGLNMYHGNQSLASTSNLLHVTNGENRFAVKWDASR